MFDIVKFAMRVIGLDRLPLPDLKVYAGLSAVLVVGSVFYAVDTTTKNPDWRVNMTEPWHMASYVSDYVESMPLLADLSPSAVCVKDIVLFMVSDLRCIWTLINMAYCCLILFGHCIQRLVFGELRVSEAQQLKEKFWNFVFYKFIFIFGVVNVQHLDEVILWCSWFSVVGFLLLLAQLCKDRFEYLSLSFNTPWQMHARLMALLIFNTICTKLLLVVCFVVYQYMETNTFAFMAAECLLVLVTSIHVLLRYVLHLYDVHCIKNGMRRGSERRAAVIYWVEVGFEFLILNIDLIHHIHMVVWTQMILSMASLIIFMQLRYLIHELQLLFRRHSSHCRVHKLVNKKFRLADPEKLKDDTCAVCWDPMESARVLPCGHTFHASCLLSWLVQDTSCPTCRQDLSFGFAELDKAAEGQSARVQPNRPNQSRYMSWLSSFAVEVPHTQMFQANSAIGDSQLDSMARELIELFPHIPRDLIIEDLNRTRSVELTAENILDGNLTGPPPMYSPEEVGDLPVPPTPSSSSFPSSADSPAFLASGSGSEVFHEDTDDTGSYKFSEDSRERQAILQERRDNMLMKARKRFLNKRKSEAEKS